MKTYGKKYWIKPSNPKFACYFEAIKRKGLVTDIFDKDGKFEELPVFEYKGQEYAVVGFDHYNGHMSKFTDPYAIYRIKVAKVLEA
ncbi:MAG: hypothetical protein KatS3mg031_3002 [Chitinophagales bacterium]|nr:MAG: hypothetical protein KatS3mg031_3002 [Chitinophagales bacterium]